MRIRFQKSYEKAKYLGCLIVVEGYPFELTEQESNCFLNVGCSLRGSGRPR